MRERKRERESMCEQMCVCACACVRECDCACSVLQCVAVCCSELIAYIHGVKTSDTPHQFTGHFWKKTPKCRALLQKRPAKSGNLP